MSLRTTIVLRPAPGGAETLARLAAAGIPAHHLPLFAVRPLAWSRPAGSFDALLLTSANAVRHAGAALEGVRALPVIAVGAATAAVARAAGLTIALTGDSDAAAALAAGRRAGFAHPLHLAGRARIALPGVTAVSVYAAEPIDPPPGALAVARGAVALLHSPRAARRFAALIDRDGVARASVRVAALSAAVAAAAGGAGGGWAALRTAATPSDAALIARAATLAIDP